MRARCCAVVATYSGSTEGLYAPSQAQAQLELSTSCGKHGDLLHKVRAPVQGPTAGRS